MKALFNLAPVVLLLFGCATRPGPSVSLVNVQFTQATVLETTGQFTLRFSNDGPAPVKLEGSSHKIYLNGLYVGEGLNRENLEIPRLSTVTQNVTAHLSNLSLATRIKAILESQVFDYQIKSVFYAGSGKLHSASEGRLDLKDFTPTPRPSGP
jgi:LEA14-like dessication related protein